MPIKSKFRLILFSLFSLSILSITAQSILPPTIDWHGKSESLIAKSNDPWLTHAEGSDFQTTPDYNETMSWFKKLTSSTPLLSMISIGKSVEGRDIIMIIGSTEKDISPGALKESDKAILLAQAGIHSGEIDGKDAGMMLLRDIAFGDKKGLLENVNFLFVPILSVDAHENASPYNRPNQRGPQNMGWRTNSQNLNLNRDYAKLDTKEVRAVVTVINDYDPDLYMDIHVTDGADYQYDITYGGWGQQQGYSPAISKWLEKTYKPFTDSELSANGHIPGQLLFALNNRDFSKGNILVLGGPRFSDSYGDLRHLPSILIENHSLKPYKQRVLGTYVLLESTLTILATEGKSLKEIKALDESQRNAKIPTKFKVAQMKNTVGFESLSRLESSDEAVSPPDSLLLLGMESRILKSSVTDSDYIEWMAKPKTVKIANFKGTESIGWITRPKGYWVPVSCDDVIERLKLHGIKMKVISESKEVSVEMYRIKDAKFENENHQPRPYEGHMRVNGTAVPEIRKEVFPAGSVYISTDQPLGDLAMMLLEPLSKDSFFSWGFFLSIFQRTEYIESYAIQPLAKKMLEESPELKKEFEQKKAEDKDFANSPYAILSWFYSKTEYYDDRYLLYPVGRDL